VKVRRRRECVLWRRPAWSPRRKRQSRHRQHALRERLDEAFTAEALGHALSSNPEVHVASHFVFAAAQAASSYLLLGDGSKSTLADLAELRCDAVDPIVLSACNTAIGGGHRQSGREIEGLGAPARDTAPARCSPPCGRSPISRPPP
jgi:CHAT domain-containing protein